MQNFFQKIEGKNRTCIKCGKTISPVFSNNPDDILWNKGIVEEISAGYGSRYDGDTFIITICDECIKNNLDILI